MWQHLNCRAKIGAVYGTGLDYTVAGSGKMGNNGAPGTVIMLTGKVSGSIRLSKLWLIHKDAPRPIDGSKKAAYPFTGTSSGFLRKFASHKKFSLIIRAFRLMTSAPGVLTKRGLR